MPLRNDRLQTYLTCETTGYKPILHDCPAHDAQLRACLLLGLLAGDHELRRVGRLAAGGFQLCGGGLLVDLVGCDGPTGQQRDDVVRHLDEAALDIESLDLAAVADPHFTVTQPPDQRRVARRDADFAVEQRHGDEIGRAAADGLLGCDDDTG